MVAYEFYLVDDKEEFHLFGTLPERRKDPYTWGSPIKRHLSREKNIPAVRKVSFFRSGLSKSCEVTVPERFIFFLPIS